MKAKQSWIERLATVIVDKRTILFLLYLLAAVFSLFSSSWVEVEDDITTYLSDTTESKQGLTRMNQYFVMPGSARVMLSNVTYETTQEIYEDIQQIDGISMVEFDDSDAHYRHASALITVTFADAEDDPRAIAAMDDIRSRISGYDAYVDTTVGVDLVAMVQSEMNGVLGIAFLIVIVVLTLTSRSYAEVPVLLLTFGAAALLNTGSNYWLGKISFISDSVTTTLQLALAIDYAIILLHRFLEERKTMAAREASIAALSKAIPEIFASSLTTISGLAALSFMEFGIGPDMSICLIKAIVFSLLSVFTLMPGLLVLFSPWIDKTGHKNLVPKVTLLGKFDVKTRYIVPPLFLIALVFGFHYVNNVEYCYNHNDLTTAKQNESQIAYQKIKSTFGSSSMVVVLLPTGNYEGEQEILAELEACDQVSTAIGLSNMEAAEGYVLTDSLTPRQFAELLDVDYEVAQLLYGAYALEGNQYGSLLGGLEDYTVPLYDMFLFLKEEMEAGNITLEGEDAEMMNEMFDQLESAQAQLQNEECCRILLYLNLPEEGEETSAFLETIHTIVDPHYSEPVYVVGYPAGWRDLASSFERDNTLISILSALFVILILLFTFRTAALPILLIVVIQGSIWFNFAYYTLTDQPLYFLGYLTVNAIQMGANIDYAIVISSHYIEKKKEMPARDAMIEALNSAFPTVFTSGSILSAAAYLVGRMSSQPSNAIIGLCLCRGTLISIVLVLFVMPQILLLGDRIIDITSFKLKRLIGASPAADAQGTIAIKGRVRGYISGMIDAKIEGVLSGQLNASVSTGTEIDVRPAIPDAAESDMEGGVEGEA